jgi:ubiquinone/menaquinone biosynthesis C-methylase UbiE
VAFVRGSVVIGFTGRVSSPDSGQFDADEVAAVFGRTAATYDIVIPFFTTFGARLVEAAALEVGERVLDAGCGRGATLLPASVAVGSVGRVVGIDLAEEMVARLGAELEAAGVDNATVRVGNAQALDMDAASFDVVLSQMVLHLLPDPPTAAAEFFRVLGPGGRCVASVPSDSPGWEFIGEIYGRYFPQATGPMAVPFRPEFDLLATLAGAGFEIVSDQQVEVEFHFPDEDGWWEWGWGNGIRALYEVLPPDALDALKRDVFAVLASRRTPDGIPYVQRVRLVVGTKPAG